MLINSKIGDDNSVNNPRNSFPNSSRHYPDKSTLKSLDQLGISLSHSGIPNYDCAGCEEPCSVPMDLEGYPSTFSIDTTAPLLGKIKEFDYLVLCSTGKSDWPHDVCSDADSIPGALRQAYPKPNPNKDKVNERPPGIFDLPAHIDPEKVRDEEEKSKDPIKMTILSSSHISNSDTSEKHSLIVLPDWVRLDDVTKSKLPKFPISPNPGYKLPHRVIILICSHKTRDKRCSISAPILEDSLMDSLEQTELDWKIDRRGDQDIDHYDPDDHWIGIFRVSHSGGHKFAGNLILNFPNGTSIWYGRVMPNDCKRVVEETIMKKKILPELLKGGVGLDSKNFERLDW
ncbi:Sucrase/ferredoxin-like-domain-containing protein [Phakopsora pachyrhizi]|uniref:Sucrase/ferredoxin-like-domain-containing protein n=1 Tax=Phakopsora pachyrhizi TaxID=170000 RepID=A0AAV0BCJ8_PHAPC|nr:Sucrase/ferredoxin-like-domain-containing protein [Phakopsora pachyrhizi]